MTQQLTTDSTRILTLEQRLTQLQALMDQQQAQMIAQSAEIGRLREQAGAAANTVPLIADTRPRRTRRMGEHERRVTSPSSRRALLKWGGAAAAAATVALVASERQSAQAAPANDGDPIIAGQSTFATSTTTLYGDGAANPQLIVMNFDSLFPGNFNAAQFTGMGTGTAVSAHTDNGIGVLGTSSGGTGVSGQSTTGVDVSAGGTGRLQLALQSSAGAPSGGSYFAGEQIRDSIGDLYICTGGGTPGVWKKVTAIPAGAAGGAPVLFAAPYRIFDTRDLTGVPINNGAGNNPMTPGQSITLRITGVVDPNDSSIVVPPGAKGIIGDLIAIMPAGSGFLGIQPHTGSANPFAWVNYDANVTIHNSVVVGLSSGGTLDIQCNQASAGAALTITGYIIQPVRIPTSRQHRRQDQGRWSAQPRDT